MGKLERVPRICGWVLSVLLALLFLMAGIPKLLGAGAHVQRFLHWGYPGWFRLLVGAVETISAVALLVPRGAPVGAAGIVVIMLGASYTHLFRAPDEAGRVVFTLSLALLALVAVVLRRR